MANEAYAGYLSSHILDTSRGLRGKNSQCESFLTDKERLQINRIPHKEITVSLKSGVEHLHYEMSS